MGVDYDGVGGIGVELTREMVERAIKRGIFTQEQWEDDESSCLENIGILYSCAGNEYTGETRWYLMVEGETLGEINKNANSFVEKVKKLGLNISVEDLEVISDGHIW